MAHELRKRDVHFLHLWDYGWFQMETYAILHSEPGGLNFSDLFCALLEHPDYHFSYMIPGAKGYWEGIHGPFHVANLSPSDFARISPKKFFRLIKENLAERAFDTPPAEEQQAALYSLLDETVTPETDFFLLDVSPDDPRYVHSLHRILDVFHEYLLIDQETRLPHVCVMGYD